MLESVADEPVDDAADDGEHEGGEGGGPEAANVHSWHDQAGDFEHEAVDDKSEEAEREEIERQGKNGDDWLDDSIDNGEDDGAEHKGGKRIEVESLHELGGQIKPKTVGKQMDD